MGFGAFRAGWAVFLAGFRAVFRFFAAMGPSFRCCGEEIGDWRGNGKGLAAMLAMACARVYARRQKQLGRGTL
jgi:hypothetical protein